MRSDRHADRKRRLCGRPCTRAAALALVLVLSLCVGPAFAQAPAPECRPGASPTPRQTEGPYFKPGAPHKPDLVEPGIGGRPIEVTGSVVTRACQPVANARIDVWQADAEGRYDNRGFRLRGHVLTDAEGRYRFRTVVPGYYEGRTRHIHIKVVAEGARTLTTQLYFPDEAGNRNDGLFRRELVMPVTRTGGALAGRFDFILDMR